MDINLENFIHNCHFDLNTALTISGNTKKTRSYAFKTLATLKRRPDIKITIADKNLGICALNLIDYNYLVQQHLNANTIELVNAPHMHIKTLVYGRLESLRREIKLKFPFQSQAQFKYIDKFIKPKWNPNFPSFHILPKLHKGGTITGRPIVGAYNWITTKLSKWISLELQCKIGPRVLKDSYSLIPTIETKPFTDNSFLISMDIKSLYPNIRLDRLYNILNNNLQLPSIFRDIIKFICDNCYFQYGSKIYRQTDGIAMGDNSAPTLANIYLSYGFDDIICLNHQVKHYSRFIDDIFFVFEGSRDELNVFIQFIKNLIDGIDVTHQISQSNVDFLDLNIFIKNGHISVRTHQKSLNRYLYLPPSSFHPKSSFKGWIKAELIRYARTNTDIADFNNIRMLFYKRLTRRNYSKKFLQPIFNNISHDIRNNYGNQNPNNPPNNPKIFPIVVRYNTDAATNYLKNHISSWNQQLQHVFPDNNTRILLAFKQPPSILRLCSTSNITTNQEEYIEQHQNVPIGPKFLQEN